MEQKTFTRYEVFVVAILAILQFTLVLDFMVISPLGPIMMPALGITKLQFGAVVAAYAISAGISGLLAAGFADKFDRKKMLLFFYFGFILGTLFCGIANTYELLFAARIFTGIFGGVIGAITFAIVTDLFAFQVRGRVMGFIQMAFASSQVLGLPIGLYLANKWGWNSPFLMIVAFSIIVAVFIVIYFKPVDAHLQVKSNMNPFVHLFKTLTNSIYLRTFAATILLATGGFMMMPFGNDYSVHNLKLDIKTEVPFLYMITGIFSMIIAPLSGKASDSWGKYKMFLLGSVIAIVTVLYYCQLGPTPMWMVSIISVVMFAGISSRMVSSSALVSAVPTQTDRGAFMSINSALQQISGGIGAIIAGSIITAAPNGELQHYEIIGYIVAGTTIITMLLMWFVNDYVMNKPTPVAPTATPVAK